jgi:flagellin
MPLVINTNVSSINAQRQMVKAGAEMDKAMSRLSSGMRINSAKDDAAGLAISNRQTSQIRGLDQAVRNANDGVSLIQTAEGALGESTNILQRMRELAVQSANGIYSDADRSTLDAEVKQLTKELDRIAKSTSFNGQNILDGSVKKMELQVGTQAGQTIEMNLQAVDAKTLGMGSLTSDLMGDEITATFDSQISLTEGDLLINGQSIIKDTNFVGSTDTVEDLLKKINENVTGVTASMVVELNASNVGTGVADSAGTTITLTKLNGATSVFNVADTNSLQEFADKVNEVAGGAISATIDDKGLLHLMAKDAQTMAVGAAGSTGIGDTSDRGRIVLTSDNGDPITIERGATGTIDKLDRLGFREIRESGVVEGVGLSNSAGGAHEALAVGELTINGVVIDHTDTDSLQGKINNINAVSDETGVTAKASSSLILDFTGYLASLASATLDNISLNGVTYDLGLAISATNTDIAAAINTFKEESGVTAKVMGRNLLLESDRGAITIGTVSGAANLLGTTAAATGLSIVQQTFMDSSAALVTSSTTIDSAATLSYQARAGLKLESINGNPISIELSNDSDAARLGLRESNNLSGGSFGQSISSISIDTAANASKALEVIDNALNTVNDIRSQLGAVNNRLDFTVSNLMNVSENTSAARSRITDADFAAESANLSRSQVLAQASQAMLAQANAKPQQVLSLLR